MVIIPSKLAKRELAVCESKKMFKVSSQGFLLWEQVNISGVQVTGHVQQQVFFNTGVSW